MIKHTQILQWLPVALLGLLISLASISSPAKAQNGDIFVLAQTLDPTGIGANAAALGDLDNDDDLDAYLGLAQLLTNSRSVAVGDSDDDLTPDVLLANLEGPKRVWPNQMVLEGADFSVGHFQEHTLQVRLRGDETDPNPINNRAKLKTDIYDCNALDGCLLERAYCQLITGQSNSLTLHSISQMTQAAFNLFIYYQLRDNVLAPTAAGQHYHNLYYNHDPELQALILNDAALLDQAVSVLNLWDPNLEALLEGNGDSIAITAKQVAAISSFLFNLSQKASPELQQVIATELTQLGSLSNYVGMTMAEARVKVVGLPMVYLPLVIK